MYGHAKKTALKKWLPEQLKVLDICQHIHTCAEELYLYLAGIHKESSEIARIWGLLAIDKCNHSDTYRMTYRLKGEGVSAINCSKEQATAILNKLKAVNKSDSSSPPSLLAALSFTVKMEEALACVHFSQVVKFFNHQDTHLMASSLQPSSSILHLLTEEYVNLTVLDSDGF